jgi:ferritin-like metal-binding protein YciE
MAPNTIEELYVEELKDLYSAENQILKALPKMIKAATHDELKDALETHRQQTEMHVRRLERIFDELGESPKGKKCHGMEGVIAEGAELIDEGPTPEVLDAGLISAAQHVEHYEMAGYGSVRTWAQQLGYEAQARLLQQTFDEERTTDELLTQLAEQSITLEIEEEIEIRDETGELADAPPRGTRADGGGSPQKRPRPQG